MSGWLVPADNAKNLRTEIRRLIASKPALERELQEAQERLHTAEGSLDLVAPAQAALEAAQTADATDRKRRMESGITAADPKLSAAVAAAEHALVEAERTQAAASAALPALKRRLSEAQQAVANCTEQIDALAWQVRMSELTNKVPEVQRAVATATAFQNEVNTLRYVAARHKAYRTPNGSVPRDVVALCKLPDILDEPPQAEIRAEVERLRRLRDGNP
ncbi:MAG: hypothetical protein M0038_04895 [Pseudomonadota bacterium]|nr:hypothetical protein [Pseudomonadota bacterium]